MKTLRQHRRERVRLPANQVSAIGYWREARMIASPRGQTPFRPPLHALNALHAL